MKPGGTRVLTPSGSNLRPFPKHFAMLLAGCVAVSVPAWPGPGIVGFIDAIAKIGAVLAGCALASWAEQRLYQGLLGTGRVKRILFTLFVPLLCLVVLLPLSLVGGLLAQLVARDDGTFASAAVMGSFWMASAAGGTAVMVVIDVVISALIPDFRSRVQVAVLSLTTIAVGFALAVYFGATALAGLAQQIPPDMIDDDDKLEIAGEVFQGEQLRALVSNEATANAIVLASVLFVAALSLPAILSACGKLADGVMERLNPLSDALRHVEDGDLGVRVEVGGSRDFVRIGDGFNRMAQSLGDTLSDLDLRNRDLAELNRATSRFVPFQFLELLQKDSIRHIAIGDQRELDMSVMFADIRGFTSMAERLGAADTFAFINRYLSHMEPEIHREQGFINDIFGDGIMALFHRGADAAVRAALGMLAALARFNERLEAEGKPPVEIGIGINSGPLMLGTIGGQERLSCTVVGDPANTAARVEGMTKLYGARLLISRNTYERLEDPTRYLLREVDLVQAKGKDAAVEIYEVLDADAAALREQKLATRDDFAAGLGAYRAGDIARARAAFERCGAGAPDDRTVALYLERCAAFRDGEPWDGVTKLSFK